jgi:hypothetical protein
MEGVSSLVAHYRKIDYELCGWGESEQLACFGMWSKDPAAQVGGNLCSMNSLIDRLLVLVWRFMYVY